MVAAKLPLGLAALLVLGLGLASADDDLKKEALALNDITGEEPIEAKFQELVAKPAQAKKLLAAAAELAKEKKDPFTYNANYILARTGQELKEIKTSEAFYNAAADQAVRLKSGQKMVQAYGGLIDLYFENKMFDETTKVCQKFLELPEDDTIERLKPAVLRRLVQAMARQGKIDDALKLVDPRVDEEGKKDGWWWLQLKGSVLREADRLDDAAKTYETVVERIEKDKTLREEARDTLSQDQSLLPERRLRRHEADRQGGRHAQGAAQGRAGQPDLQQRPGLHLGRPRHEPGRGGEADPQGPRGRPEAAQGHPEHAARGRQGQRRLPRQPRPGCCSRRRSTRKPRSTCCRPSRTRNRQHIEIYDHLGDVYEALKDKAKALEAYKKGLELAGKSKREQDRKAKVEEKIKKLQQ